MKNSSGTFQRIVNVVLGEQKGKDALAYMDDVNVGSKDEKEHLISLNRVLTLLSRAGMKLKLSKCSFGIRSVDVLGHHVGPDGLKPSFDHVRAI